MASKRAEKNKKEEIQQTYLQLQQIEEQIQQLEQEAQVIEQRRAEISALLKQIDCLKGAKGAKIFSNIGSGIYAQAELASDDEFLVNVGAGKFVKKRFSNIKKILNKQLDELKKIQTQVMQSMQVLAIQSQAIQSQVQKKNAF